MVLWRIPSFHQSIADLHARRAKPPLQFHVKDPSGSRRGLQRQSPRILRVGATIRHHRHIHIEVIRITVFNTGGGILPKAIAVQVDSRPNLGSLFQGHCSPHIENRLERG
jgi:hypothetical protein